GTDERQYGHGGDGDAAEWKKVAELREFVEAQDPSAKEEDDFALRRFLRARDHNINKASVMLLRYLAWKRVTKPHGFISDDEVRGEIAKGRDRHQGFDRLGRPMSYLYGGRHFPVRRDHEDLKRYVVYVFDKICTKYVPHAADRAGEVCGGDRPEGMGVCKLRHPWVPGRAGHHAELLPRAAGPRVPDPRALPIHGCVEDCVPLNR
uniref:CRAL/TRIO N-terminal domain-containing protein n=1 Tax=Aegilops tauschii subsp. strangulata TaxID=200361 RepID=A0A453MHZ7_AEGTS